VSPVRHAHVVEFKRMMGELLAARNPGGIIGARRDAFPTHIVGENDVSRPVHRSFATGETSDRVEFTPRWHEKTDRRRRRSIRARRRHRIQARRRHWVSARRRCGSRGSDIRRRVACCRWRIRLCVGWSRKKLERSHSTAGNFEAERRKRKMDEDEVEETQRSEGIYFQYALSD